MFSHQNVLEFINLECKCEKLTNKGRAKFYRFLIFLKFVEKILKNVISVSKNILNDIKISA